MKFYPRAGSRLTTVPEAISLYDLEEPLTEIQFRASADLQEGCSGRRPIDTTFENTHADKVNRPRSSADEEFECMDGHITAHRKL